MNFPPIPIAEAINSLIELFVVRYSKATRAVAKGIKAGIENSVLGIELIPPLLIIAVISALAYRYKGKKSALISALGLGYILNQNLWNASIETLVLVLISALLAIAIGIPLGIGAGLSKTFRKATYPVLDFMQTLPAYIYLIPAIAFFGLGSVPAIFATILYSIAPIVRLTAHGIEEVPDDLKEAADAFGSTRVQRLVKIELPLALPTIFTGIQQTIMLALSMVVFSAMIGAGGLGTKVWFAIQRLDFTAGIRAGLGIVVLALILETLTQPKLKQAPCIVV